MRMRGWAFGAAFLAAAACLNAAQARESGSEHWVGTWATAEMDTSGNWDIDRESYRDATLRQIVHVSLGGTRLRVHLSNAFGIQPLHISAVRVARAKKPGSAAIDPATDKALTFNGRTDVTLPAGGEYLSDPVDFDLPAHSDLAITLHYDSIPYIQTGHPGSRTTSFLMRGDHTADAGMSGATPIERWFQIAAVDVTAPKGTFAVAALGDSITDGHGATTDANNRWTDVLADRLDKAGVLNFGIGGGRLLLDFVGPGALARFDRDVLGQSGVKTVIVFEGINDLGHLTRFAPTAPEEHAAMVQDIIGAYKQLIARGHGAGLRVVGATLTPFVDNAYYHPGEAGEADRQAINAWIRAPGHFDAVIDFDAAVRDPAHPDRYLPAYDLGDHLHPSPAGYRAMGEAIALKLLKEP